MVRDDRHDDGSLTSVTHITKGSLISVNYAIAVRIVCYSRSVGFDILLSPNLIRPDRGPFISL